MAQTSVESLLMRLREKEDETSELERTITKLHDELVSAHSCLENYNEEVMELVAEMSCLKSSLAACFLSTRP